MPETAKKQNATVHFHLNGQGKQQLLIKKSSINEVKKTKEHKH
jgi:hypothetical protein